MPEKLIFDKSSPGRIGYSFSTNDLEKKPVSDYLPREQLRKKEARLPELFELDVVRHYTRLSHKNFSIDGNFYPLGSCTMKYNPKVNDVAASIPGFTRLHPLQSSRQAEGTLVLLSALEKMLCDICGFDAFSLNPAAGAQGELTGLLIIKACHEKRNEKRNKVLVPLSAHGTNPASATLAGFETVVVPVDEQGLVRTSALDPLMQDDVAGMMMTNPNTYGLFEEEILEVARMIHDRGGLLYYDGANLNATLGYARPGDMGFDVCHINLHKTFSTPHGAGGPGCGPVGVTKELEPFLPVPRIVEKEGSYQLVEDCPDAIGRVNAFQGNVGVALRAYAYIMQLGPEGLRRVSESAVLGANYLLQKFKKYFDLPFGHRCMHEFVASAANLKDKDLRAFDIAKRMLDDGFHSPTVYFPLGVPEGMMVEPTDTESKDTLDEFGRLLDRIMEEAENHPDTLHQAPRHTPVRRLDEVLAARKPVLRWQGED
jgi:glycine dehydrogenase subunit 2